MTMRDSNKSSCIVKYVMLIYSKKSYNKFTNAKSLKNNVAANINIRKNIYR